jgi:uncharacterized phage protein (TIGR02218 family)
MKTATQAMKDYFAQNRNVLVADLYTFTLANGAGVMRYTPYDKALTVGGNTWLTGGPLITRGGIRSEVGLDVKTMDLMITPRDTDLVNAVPWLKAARRGAFDGCYVLLERTTPDDTTRGKYWKFSGSLADIEADRMTMKATVRSREEVFNRLFPIDIFQPGCRRTLYDTLCTAVKNNFKASSTVQAGSTATVLNCGLAQAAGLFALGTVAFTSGALAGLTRTVKSYTPGVITLSRPLTAVPSIGDGFDAFAGCDKQQATCGALVSIAFTADPATDILSATAHGLANNQAVLLASSGTLPAPLTSSGVYIVSNAAADTFKLKASLSGSVIDITTAGSGTHSVVQKGRFANLANFSAEPFVPAPETAV